MNHEPNTTQWKVGDLVLHDGDRKDADMLMKVVRIQKNGIYVTQYIGEYKRWKNEVEYLHDPARFGVSVEETEIHDGILNENCHTTISSIYDDDPLVEWCRCKKCDYSRNTTESKYCGGCGRKIDWGDLKDKFGKPLKKQGGERVKCELTECWYHYGDKCNLGDYTPPIVNEKHKDCPKPDPVSPEEK